MIKRGLGFLLLVVLVFFAAGIRAAEYPQFSEYWDNNGSQVGTGTAYANVTMTSTNGTVILTVAGFNFTASNSSGDATRFNVTVPALIAGVYPYYWISYGNDTENLYNFSDMRSYTINATPDTNPPYFVNLANQSLLQGQSLSYDINAADAETGIGNFAINWTGTFSIVQSTGVLTNISELLAGDYYINVSVNDTLGNLNSTILWVSVVADTTAPKVTLSSPSDEVTWTSSSLVTFIYSVTDSNNITSCSLIINGAIDNTETSITKGTSQDFLKTMTNGNYTWSINCTDAAGNKGNSSVYNLTVNYGASSQIPSENEGNTTTSGDTNLSPESNDTIMGKDISGEEKEGIFTQIKGWVENIFEKASSYVRESKPQLLWILTGVIIAVLLVVVLLWLRRVVKRVKFKKSGDINPEKEMKNLKSSIKNVEDRKKALEEIKKKVRKG